MSCSKEIRWYLAALAAIIPVFFLDESAMVWIKAFRNANPDISSVLTYTDKAAYFAGHGTPLIGGAVIVLLAGIFLRRNLLLQRGKELLIGFIAAGVGVQLVKHIIGRARPRITDQLLIIGPTFKGSFDSLPSGHATMAFCLAYLCSGYFPKCRPLFYLYAIFVCVGRVLSTSHFPADVLAGALLGIIIARLVERRLGSRDSSSASLSA